MGIPGYLETIGWCAIPPYSRSVNNESVQGANGTCIRLLTSRWIPVHPFLRVARAKIPLSPSFTSFQHMPNCLDFLRSKLASDNSVLGGCRLQFPRVLLVTIVKRGGTTYLPLFWTLILECPTPMLQSAVQHITVLVPCFMSTPKIRQKVVNPQPAKGSLHYLFNKRWSRTLTSFSSIGWTGKGGFTDEGLQSSISWSLVFFFSR